MNQKALDYINQNRDRFGRETLAAGLRSSGYPEAEIWEAMALAYGTGNQTVRKSGFWDFRSKKEYASGGEKAADFAFGFFAPYLGGFLSGILAIFFVGFLLGIFAFGLEIFSIFFLFNRRRFISYGLLANLGSGFLIILIFLMLFANSLYF